MSQSYKIMVVEDSSTQAMKIRLLLEAEGWSVETAKSAEIALDSLNQVTPDVIIVDYNLPGMKGDELCRQLRMNVKTRGVLTIMLTAENSQAGELRGLDSGADHYISKSIDDDLFVTRIRNLLRKSKLQSTIVANVESSFQRAKLLTVDDSATYLQFLKETLIIDGYNVETASSGLEALEKLTRETFDCVLVDLVMPDLDGIAVVQKLNSMRSSFEKPLVVLMLTARESKEDMTRALDAGADDFVGKSNDVAVLKGRIRALLRRKFYQEENQRINEELTKKELETVRIRSEKETLDLALKLKSEFVATMSHEIRTPMNGILGMTGLLLESELNETQRHYTSVIHTSGTTLLRILNDILDFSKIEAGKMDIEKTEFDPRSVMNNVTGLMSGRAKEKNVSLSHQVEDNVPPTLLGDPVRISQVILNLVSNAVKFTSNGQVKVTLKVQSKDIHKVTLLFEVADTGVGISQATQDKLFQAFSQADTSTTRRYGGTGLGLSISKHLVELMGGSIGVQSEETKGSKFFFTVSFEYSSQTLANKTIDSSTKPTQSSKNVQPSGPILVAEDNPINRETILAQMKKLEYPVHIVDNGRDAIQAVSAMYYSMVLMDCEMPEMDGFEATRAIRALEVTSGRHIPIIAMTANALNGDKERCLRAGMDDHLSKPANKDDINTIVQRWSQKGHDLLQQVSLHTHETQARPETSNPSLPAQILDLQVIQSLRDLESDSSVLIAVVGHFLDMAPLCFEKLDRALASQNPKAVKGAVHDLMSGSGSLGIRDMNRFCRKIHQITSASSLEGVAQLIISIKSEFKKARPELEKLRLNKAK